MTLLIAWNSTTEGRFDEMLGMLPPAYMSGNGFLVGEAYDHRECSISHRVAPTFTAFIRDGENYYTASEPLTIAEFKASGMVS